MKKEYGAFKYVDIETECFDLASDEEIGHDAKSCTLQVQLAETEEGA